MTALIVLQATSAGGRVKAVSLGGEYRPHVQVDGGQLLGVIVSSGAQSELLPGESVLADLQLPFDVDYSELRPGARFVIREGPNLVGFGEVVGENLEG